MDEIESMVRFFSGSLSVQDIADLRSGIETVREQPVRCCADFGSQPRHDLETDEEIPG
jgi:hypothetical protein